MFGKINSFPGATNETLLQKFNSVHRDNKFYEKPQKKENAFIIRHYAGKVKYQVINPFGFISEYVNQKSLTPVIIEIMRLLFIPRDNFRLFCR